MRCITLRERGYYDNACSSEYEGLDMVFQSQSGFSKLLLSCRAQFQFDKSTVSQKAIFSQHLTCVAHMDGMCPQVHGGIAQRGTNTILVTEHQYITKHQ